MKIQEILDKLDQHDHQKMIDRARDSLESIENLTDKTQELEERNRQKDSKMNMYIRQINDVITTIRHLNDF